jgi:hypothetical protein
VQAQRLLSPTHRHRKPRQLFVDQQLHSTRLPVASICNSGEDDDQGFVSLFKSDALVISKYLPDERLCSFKINLGSDAEARKIQPSTPSALILAEFCEPQIVFCERYQPKVLNSPFTV